MLYIMKHSLENLELNLISEFVGKNLDDFLYEF